MELLHALFAMAALLTGGLQVVRRKQGRGHVWLGRAWVTAMTVTALSSFFLRDLTGGFNFLHGLSLFMLVSLGLGVWRARQSRFAEHGLFMINCWGGLMTAGWMAAARHGLELPGAVHGAILAGFWFALILATIPLHRQARRNRGRAEPRPDAGSTFMSRLVRG